MVFYNLQCAVSVCTPTQATTLCLSVGVWWWLGYAFFTAMHNHTWWPYMWKPHTCIVFVCGIHTCQFRIITIIINIMVTIITSIMVTIIIIIITTTMAISITILVITISIVITTIKVIIIIISMVMFIIISILIMVIIIIVIITMTIVTTPTMAIIIIIMDISITSHNMASMCCNVFQGDLDFKDAFNVKDT